MCITPTATVAVTSKLNPIFFTSKSIFLLKYNILTTCVYFLKVAYITKAGFSILN